MAEKKQKEGVGYTGPPQEIVPAESRRKNRKAVELRPGDVMSLPVTVAEVSIGPSDVLVVLVDGSGGTHTIRRAPDDGIDEVERPESPTIPFRGPNFAGGMSRGPV